MRRLTRYIIWEFLSIFITTLTAISLLMVVVVVLVEAIRQGLLAPMSVLRLLPYAVPDALLFAIPVTTLFAACSIYGRLSASNELTAVKAAGVSPMAMLWPTLMVSLILSVVVIWLNDVAVTWGRAGVKRVLLESVEQIVYSMLRSQKSYSTPRFAIHVRGIDGHRMLNPTVTLRLDHGPPTNIMAEEAELRCDPEAETLTIVLRDCEITMGKFHGDFPGEITRVIPLADATRRGADRNRPSDTRLNYIPQAIRDQNAQLEELKRSLAAEASLQMLTGDLDSLTDEDWSGRHAELNAGMSRLHRLHTEPWRRAANGFSCFFFALVAAPLAVRLRTADVWTSFAVCFLGLLPLYYPLMMFGADLAKSGDMPPYCVWTGNVVLGVVGWILVRKMQRY